MQGQQSYQPKLFSMIRLEELIPERHLLRRVDAVLDLTFIRSLTREFYCPNNGRPSVDPELFLRMVLVGYFNGIRSDRQLCEEIGFNLAYRWFCRLSLEDSVPDHSSLTRIRDRLGEKTFEKIFDSVLELCKERGLVDGKEIMTDGTLIRADASKKSMKPRDPGDKNDYDSGPKRGGPALSSKTHVSQTDPEATLVGKKYQRKELRYKSHTTIDAKNRIVVDCHVTTGAVAEGSVLPQRINHLRYHQGLPIEEVTADRGYGWGKNLDWLKRNEVKSYISRFHKDTGFRDGYDPRKFVYDPINDEYECPDGNTMYPFKTPDRGYTRYRIMGGLCFGCEREKICLPQGRKSRRVKHISRHVHQDLFEETAIREKEPEFIAKLRERMET